MQKIIFSVWSDEADKPEWRDLIQPWTAHKNEIIEKQKQYAHDCGADYQHFIVDHNFTDLMFYKILLAEELTKKYDKVLYLDCDVVPKTNISFFDVHDFNKICLHRTQKPDWKIQHKQMMLHMDNIQGNNLICNTGVFGLSKKKAINQLEKAGFSLGKVYYRQNEDLIPYTVLDQSVKPGTVLENTIAIDLTISVLDMQDIFNNIIDQ